VILFVGCRIREKIWNIGPAACHSSCPWRCRKVPQERSSLAASFLGSLLFLSLFFSQDSKTWHVLTPVFGNLSDS
jgi:hypothetical protein